MRAHSIEGLVPLFAAVSVSADMIAGLPELAERIDWFVDHYAIDHAAMADFTQVGPTKRQLLAVVGRQRIQRMLARLLDTEESLSPHGLRSVSRYHHDHPLHLDYNELTADLDYEPAESTIAMFDGNSNWRGPVWMPLNYLTVLALNRLYQYFGDELTVEIPTGSGNQQNLQNVAAELSRRLVSIFLDDADGRRPVFGDTQRPHSPVQMAPDLRFGRPAIKGISTEVISEHEEAGEDVEEIAEAFGLTVDDARWALAYETSLRAA